MIFHRVFSSLIVLLCYVSLRLLWLCSEMVLSSLGKEKEDLYFHLIKLSFKETGML